MASAPARSDDPAWAHGQVVIDAKNSSICVHCSKRINGGGVTRLKYHLAGIKGQVEACKKVPPDVKWQMKQLIEDLAMEKEKRKRLRIDIENSQSLSSDEVEKGDSVNPTLSDIGSQANKRLTMQGTNGWSNRRNVPIVNFLAYSPRVDTSSLRKDKETLLEMFDEVVKEVGQENIVQFVSDNESAFKAVGKALQQRPSFSKQKEVTRGWLSTITRLVPDCDTQDLISGQLEEYKKATCDFGMPLAIRQKEKLNPEPSLFDGDDISWETIKAPLSTLTLEDEETCFDEENIELGGSWK
ncbi:hypothetical protein POTOM_044507 [Populus tomentosa]|uniref:BED-type domain-containing protein n=1 Tax=Populus tomentosa TaxID=118781 RepID=A0A8X8CFA9_POPTO|nr:hypothetical protein POTOM_044507 [Populus tomentosa]